MGLCAVWKCRPNKICYYGSEVDYAPLTVEGMDMSSGWLWSEEEGGIEDGNGGDLSPPSKRKKTLSLPAKIGKDTDHALTVSQLNQWIKNTLDRQLYPIWLEAEISDLARPVSGHLYLTLKDEQSQIRGVMWKSSMAKLPFQPKDGLAVMCYGNLDVYAPRGTYQFIIQKMQPKGLGALQLAFQQLHAKLSGEGLFDVSRKKNLPNFPRRIGFVTSPSGAAIHDFLQVLQRRWRGVEVLIIPSKVQGEGAAEEIARGIRVAARVTPKLDVLVVGRGGGSMEDLWCFNEEVVVRAIAACPLPTVSAVGHEIDVTLSDLAADVRALTPTEAAERLLPDAEDLQNLLQRTERHLSHVVMQRLQLLRKRIEQLGSRPVLVRPEDAVKRLNQRIDELQMRLDHAVDRIMEKNRRSLEKGAATLEALSPLRVLSRGYSVTRLAGTQRVLRSSKEVQAGDQIETMLSDGSVKSQVLR